jgi:type IV pilus assembly protein PilF
MGKLYQAAHDLPRSMALLEKARELAPNDWRTAARLATVQQEAGLSQQAKSNYEHAVQLGADDAELFNNLAYLEAEIGRDLDTAGVHAQKALQKSPSNPSYADTVGIIYLKKKQTAAALQVFKALTERVPKEALFRYHLALALRQNGDVQAAGRELRAALQADRSLALDPSAQSILREYGLKNDLAQ